MPPSGLAERTVQDGCSLEGRAGPMLRQLLERPVSVSIGALTLVILGFFSLLRLPVSLLPTLERPRLVVAVRDADLARDDLVRRVAEPLERRLLSLPGVLEVHTRVEDGACTLSLETEWQTDVDRLRIDAERRLAEVSGSGVDELSVRVEAGDRAPILQIAVLGGRSPADRTVFADKVLIPELGRLAGAGQLRRLGGASLRPVVRPNAADLAARGLTSADLVERLGQVGRTRPVGSVRDGARVRPLVIREPVRSIAELESRRLGSETRVTLGEVAQVSMEEVPDAGTFRRNGEAGVLVEVHRAPGANAVLLARAARQTVGELARRSVSLGAALRADGRGPGSPRLEIVRDASLEVTAALTRLAAAAVLGLLLGTLVLRWMLGSWRPTVALAVVVPASIVAAFGGFHLWNVSLDVVSLAGLALAAGMLIDNSIVVLEAIESARGRRQTPNADDGAVLHVPPSGGTASPELEGTRQIAMALIASFLTTAVVFLPLIYLQGLARAFFGVQAFAIVTSLLVSLALSLSLTPVLARGVGYAKPRYAKPGCAKPCRGSGPARRHSPLRGSYLALLDRALARPWVVIAATAALLAGAAALLPALPRELMPSGQSRVLAIDYRLPAGLSREETERRIDAIEQAAGIGDGDLDSGAQAISIYRRRGTLRRDPDDLAGDPSGGTPSGDEPPLDSDRGEIELVFSGAGDLEPARRQLAQRLARLPGVDAEVTIRRSAIASAVERSSRRLEIELTAATAPRAEQLAERVAETLRQGPSGFELRRAGGLGGVSTGQDLRHPAFVLAWDAWRLAELDAGGAGLPTAALENQVRAALGGFYAGRADVEGAEPEILVAATRPDDPRLIPLRPRESGPDAEEATPSAARGEPRVVPLAALAQVERRFEPPPMERLGGRPAVRLAVAGGAAANGQRRLEQTLAGVPLGLDQRIRLGGQAHEMRRSFDQLRLALVLALVLVFLTVAALYESLTMPLVVMTTVPVAAAGAVGALALTSQSLNVMSFLGVILLTGIVVNNAIVLVHRIEQLAKAGRSSRSAVREAASERYRPILMTTLTTLLGMIPLAALGGEGAEMRGALAIAVSGGLLTSLYAALFVVPVLHRALVKRNRDS